MPTQAETTSALVLAEAARQSQVRLRRELVSDVSKVWRVLDFRRLQETWPVWLQVMTSTLTRYHAQSADDGALFYRATRQLEVGDPGTAKLAEPPSQEWVSKALGYAAPGTYQRQTVADAPPDVAERSALVQTLGTASRIVQDGSRSTIQESVKADPVALGYYRVTDGDPCAFCALMASRGMVYKDEATAGKDANARFIGAGLFKYHNNCGCTIAPGFKRGMPVTGVAAEAAEIYKNRGKGDAMNAFRRDWEARNKDPETRRKSSKPAVSNRKGAPKAVDTTRDVDASRSTEELKATLAGLEASLQKFDSPGTRKRVEELRKKISDRG